MTEETCSNSTLGRTSRHNYEYILGSSRTIKYCSKCNQSWELQGEVTTEYHSNYGWVLIPTIQREREE